MSIPPYPDELGVWKPQVEAVIAATFLEAGRVVDMEPQRWGNRIQYDYLAGLTLQQSIDKHIRDLRIELQLPVGPPPMPIIDLAELTVPAFDAIFHDARNNRPTRIHGTTAFTLLQYMLEARDLSRFFAWAQALGINAMRVFGMWAHGDGIFDARAYGSDYFPLLRGTADTLKQLGFHLYFVPFTDQVDGSPILMTSNDRVLFMDHVRDALTGCTNVLVEGGNEDWKNGLVTGDLKFGNLLGCRSAPPSGTDHRQYGSLLQWTNDHTPRDGEWPRKAKDLLETARLGIGNIPPTYLPALGGEPMGIFETDVSGSRSSNPRDHADYAAVAEIYSAGMVMHGDRSSMQFCMPPGPQGQKCAEAIAAVWRAGIPADTVLQHYTRGGFADCPVAHDDSLALRTFAMTTEHTAIAVAVRRAAGHSFAPMGDWRVVDVRGPHGQIAFLER